MDLVSSWVRQEYRELYVPKTEVSYIVVDGVFPGSKDFIYPHNKRWNDAYNNTINCVNGYEFGYE